MKDFIINRNPELALTVLHPRSTLGHLDGEKDPKQCDEIVKIYVRGLKEKLKSNPQLNFNNLNSFFHHTMGVVKPCAVGNTYKNGTGHFQYILDRVDPTHTVKFRFDYLQTKPLRKFHCNRHSLGLPIKSCYVNKWEKNEND